MKPLLALVFFCEVVFLRSTIAEEVFDCRKATSCNTPCSSSSSASKVFHWFVGETLLWDCTLGDKCTNATSADINFCFKGNVHDNLTHIIDSRTKELRIPNVTEDNVGSYFCYVAGCLAADIEMQIAYRAEPPDVEVFYDILNTAAQKLTVVAMPTERNRNVNWTWDIRYKLNTRRPEMEYEDINDSCPTKNKGKICDASLDAFPCGCPESESGSQCMLLNEGENSCFITDRNHTFRVNMSSESFGSAYKDVWIKASYDVARAPEVYNVTFEKLSQKAEVRWRMWPGLSNMKYQVACRRVGTESWQERLTYNTALNITGLVPDTPYQARISAKFNRSDKWSKPVIGYFNTTEGVPSESPKLSVGSYIRGFTPDCPESGKRSLFLYTQPIPKKSQNGKLLSIEVNVNPPLPNQRNPVVSPVANQTVALCGVRMDEDYVVELRGRTKIGASVVPSRIIIPSKALPKPIQVVAEKLDGSTVHVRWTVQSNTSQPYNVTIHHCQQVDRHLKCLSGYDWLTLTGPVSSHNITVPDLDQTQSDFRFGVSMEQDGVSSGIAWSSCLYDRPSGPGEVTEFQMEPFKRRVELKWSPPDCGKLTSFPSSYEVRYGVSDAEAENSSAQCNSVSAMSQTKSMCRPDLVSGTVCETILEPLKPGQRYYVCVRGISDSRSAKWIFRQLYTLDDTNMALIVGLCVSGIVLIVIIVLCRSWYVKQKKEDSFKCEIPGEVPDPWNPYYTDRYGYNTVSTDIHEESNSGSPKHMGNGGSPIHVGNGSIPQGNGSIPQGNGSIPQGNGSIPNGMAHHSEDSSFHILTECPNSPGPESSVPGSPVPLLHSLRGDLQEASSSQTLTRQNPNLPGDVSPVGEDLPKSDLSEDSDTEDNVNETPWADESDDYESRHIGPPRDSDTFQDSSSSLQDRVASGSTDELLTKQLAGEERKDKVGQDNYGGPASRSNSMTSYSRLSSVRQGTSTSQPSSDLVVSSTKKTPVTEEELVKQKALEKHRAAVNGAEGRTEQTMV